MFKDCIDRRPGSTVSTTSCALNLQHNLFRIMPKLQLWRGGIAVCSRHQQRMARWCTCWQGQNLFPSEISIGRAPSLPSAGFAPGEQRADGRASVAGLLHTAYTSTVSPNKLFLRVSSLGDWMSSYSPARRSNRGHIVCTFPLTVVGIIRWCQGPCGNLSQPSHCRTLHGTIGGNYCPASALRT